MNSYTDKSKQKSTESVANAIGQQKKGNSTVFQFVDNRPETARQLGLKDSIKNAPIQGMFKSGSSSWSSHKKSVSGGADQLALFGSQPAGQSKASATVDLFDVPDISQRDDVDMVGQSFDNIESQSWNVAKKQGSAPRTEVVGEAVAMNVMLGKKGYKLAMPVAPGHGTGVDQVWYKGTYPGAVTEWLIVEAKGPNAKLSTSFEGLVQMSKPWVVDRIKKMINSSDANKSAIATEIDTAITNGHPEVKGLVITAKTAGTFSHKQGKYQHY